MRKLTSYWTIGLYAVLFAQVGTADQASIPSVSTPSLSTPSATATDAPTKAENSQRKKLLKGERPGTAEEQSNNPSDVELTRKIRLSLTSDTSLSADAHNIKILSKDGGVTLRGTVKNAKELEKIESVAASLAGRDKISSELQVK